MPSAKELAKALAYRGEIRNTPQNSFLGGVANFLSPVSEFADRDKLPESIPLLGGMSFADLSGLKGAQSLVNDMSYGKSPISGASLQTTKVDPRVLDLTGVSGAMIPVGKALGKAALREGARQIHTGTGIGRAALNPRMSAVPEGASMPQRPKTEFEILHDTAQRNAALPKEQGGLGLPANNTYIDRANAPGMFPTDAYHFTNSRFSEFDPKYIGSATDEGWLGSGFYTTTDKKLGDNWNKQVSMPLRVADQNNLEVPYTNLGQDKRSNVSSALGEMGNMTPIEVNDALDRLGKTGITMDYSPSGYLHKEIMSVAPNQLRSRFAAFDPMRRHEADILAGVGVGGMLDPQAIAEALRQQDIK